MLFSCVFFVANLNVVECVLVSEEDGQWVEEQKLESHSDWVRDVAWAPSIGSPKNVIASGGTVCKQTTNSAQDLSISCCARIMY